jgi:hypothetical protein
MNALNRTSEQLWQEYFFLTKEMAKFIEKQDMDLFDELLDQRSKLQLIIEDTPDRDFKRSEKGKRCFAAIQQTEQIIKQKLEYMRNVMSRQNQVSNAYDGYATSILGRRMDRQS